MISIVRSRTKSICLYLCIWAISACIWFYRFTSVVLQTARMTTLHNYESNTAVAIDIVFVHGLEGDANLTWINRNGAFFPDLLSFDPKLKHMKMRIHTYGYPNGMFKFETNQPMKLEDRADEFLSHLWISIGKTSEIVFIAHSMGGLVVKQAIYNAKLQYPNIFNRVHGVIFYATPHTGAAIADLLNTAAGAILSVAMKNLSPSYVSDLNKRFNTILDDKQMQILSLCERTATVPLLASMIVPKESCNTFAPFKLEHSIPLQYDHSEICKPASSEDIRYAVARQYLIDLHIDPSMKHEVNIVMDDNHHIQKLNYTMIYNHEYCSHHYEWLFIKGMFYSGTNQLHYLMRANFDFLGDTKLVPNSASYKHDIAYYPFNDSVLHIYTIKHPLVWLSDACKEPFDFVFDDNWWLQRLCPMHIAGHQVWKTYGDGANNKSWNSLVEYYNEWYLNPFRATIKGLQYSFIVVKYEDILFKPEQLAKQLLLCIDGELKDKNNLWIDPWDEYMSTKDALQYYAKPFSPLYSTQDIKIIKMLLSNELLKLFDYKL